ncbi:unnamed protein product [Leptidea sinapis]|uniref:Protein krueppel n=1 Tax=Leptidea sinapis TaxID=189913 RepID=A0A5E4QE63_9NEOP|nr:unnamed protein product [Leptidea sinapis]
MDEQDHKLICRCCLSTERRMKKIDNFRYLFVDFADIIITDTDGLPQWICWECEAIIHKSVRFKHKMLKVNAILYDYVKRCAPFAIDSQDVELKGCSISTLSMTNTLILDSKNKNGVPEVVEEDTKDDLKLPYHCHLCFKGFIFEEKLNNHMKKHSPDHSCPVCAKKFRTRQQVVHHQVKHTDNKNFYCVECDVRFKTTSALRQHLRRSTRHRDVDSLLFQCDSCPKRFESAAQLSQHRGVQHEGSRPYPCPQCACALATRSSLAKHMRAVHGGQRPPPVHVCDTCGKVFRAKSTLVNHVRTHTGEKPFSCSECGRRFTQRTAMRTHVKLVHLKMHRSAKLKPKLPAEVTKAEPFKDDVTLVFEWNKQMQTCEYFTVTAGP